MKQVRVLLAEDHWMVREGFRGLLKRECDIQIVGEAANGREAVQLAKKLRPDVVVMDIAMPVLNGLKATRQILRALPATKIIMLSAHADDAYIEEALAAGAVGYLLKQSSSTALCEAIREVQRGNTFFSPSIDKRFGSHYPASSPFTGLKKTRIAVLSSREVEVVRHIAGSQPNKQIAAELNLSIKTIERHRQNLMKKLNLHNTASLTRYAMATGIIVADVEVTITLV
jgi:DNA-binding NarL/FixJ family response regulator